MAKIDPNAVAPEPVVVEVAAGAGGGVARAATEQQEPPTVLTVWRKSLLFNCDGFTVFDASGDLSFRIDCYTGSRGRIVIMDATGKPLLTVRRKTRLDPSERWVIYNGDADADKRATPLLSVRRHAAGLLGRGTSATNCKTLARVAAPLTSPANAGAEATTVATVSYMVEGSYGRRSCAVRDAACGGAVVAEVQRKEAVGDDVFHLVVPGARLGAPLAMALVVALDDMFRASSAGGWSLLRRTLSA